MPAYKDPSTRKWYAQIYYQDKDGNNRQKKKRGFKTKKEALEYERDFKNKNERSISMRFRDFIDLYVNDMKVYWKPNTLRDKLSKFNLYILPYFGDMILNEINVIDIRDWQNQQKQTGLAETTLRKNHIVLSSVFNYAVKYYDLHENPCKRAGVIGSTKNKQFEIWTLEEYQQFRELVTDNSYKVAFDTLYYTGLRIGELTALTPEDFDFSVPKLTVNKNYQVIGGKEYITTPKTEKSNRDVILPEKIAEEIKEFIGTQYKLDRNDRIFSHNKSSYGNILRKIIRDNNLKQIRVHDLRHSHASLLIELGYSPVLIAERLGHEDIKTTLNTYSHLYPSKQKEMTETINDLI